MPIMGSAKDEHGDRESDILIREEWPFLDKGILDNSIRYHTTGYVSPRTGSINICLRLSPGHLQEQFGVNQRTLSEGFV